VVEADQILSGIGLISNAGARFEAHPGGGTAGTAARWPAKSGMLGSGSGCPVKFRL
jgi:hypothetical protein